MMKKPTCLVQDISSYYFRKLRLMDNSKSGIEMGDENERFLHL